MDLSYDVRESGGTTILDLKGRLTLGEECATLRKAVTKLLEEGRKDILLNLAGVSRVDSSGIGTLVETVILAAKAGGGLKLVNIPRLLHNSLVIHRLFQAFEIFNNEEEALSSFQRAS